jgi:hypothetical protein
VVSGRQIYAIVWSTEWARVSKWILHLRRVRGSPSQTNIGATFTIANTGPTSVTVLNDAIFLGTLSGSNLTVSVLPDASIMRVGQTVYLNGTSYGTIQSQSSGTTGQAGVYVVSGSGTVASTSFGCATRNITVSGGTTFADTFESSYTNRIYKVN